MRRAGSSGGYAGAPARGLGPGVFPPIAIAGPPRIGPASVGPVAPAPPRLGGRGGRGARRGGRLTRNAGSRIRRWLVRVVWRRRRGASGVRCDRCLLRSFRNGVEARGGRPAGARQGAPVSPGGDVDSQLMQPVPGFARRTPEAVILRDEGRHSGRVAQSRSRLRRRDRQPGVDGLRRVAHPALSSAGGRSRRGLRLRQTSTGVSGRSRRAVHGGSRKGRGRARSRRRTGGAGGGLGGELRSGGRAGGHSDQMDPGRRAVGGQGGRIRQGSSAREDTKQESRLRSRPRDRDEPAGGAGAPEKGE